MTDEKIKFLDEDYDLIPRVKPSRQIKTRSSSFSAIREKYNQFRISRLEKKLDKKVEKALTQELTQDDFDKKITKNSEVIARLEEKILFLSKQNVPENYVARRAIKLRKSMIANLSHNVGSYYTVGLENRDKIMNESLDDTVNNVGLDEVVPLDDIKPLEDVKPIDSTKEEVMPYEEKNVSDDEINVTNNLDRDAIVDAVNSSFEDAKDNESVDNSPKIIDTGDVRDAINEEFEIISEDTPVIDKEVVRKAVDEAFNKLDDENSIEMPTIEENVDKEIDRIRVSRNNTKAVDSTQYDENGNRRLRRKKYDYTPMTDEEIRQSQIKLGFDEHGNLIDTVREPKETIISNARVVDNIVTPTMEDVFVPAKGFDENVREKPVVVKDRDAKTSDLDMEEEKNMFDVIEPEVESKHDEVSTSMSIDDYSALREKIMKLQKQKIESQRQREEAQKRAEEVAAKAKEAKEMYEVSQANYNERMNKLRAYAATLEAACSENEKYIAEAERESQEGADYIQTQKDKANKTNQIISEIDLMMDIEEEKEENSKVK